MNDKIKASTYNKYKATTYLDGNSAAYVDGLYEDYLRSKDSVPPQWQQYFLSIADGQAPDASHADIRAMFAEMALCGPMTAAVSDKQGYVDRLIYSYRRFAHLSAQCNPLYPAEKDARLSLMSHNLSEADLATEFSTQGVLSAQTAPLQAIVDELKAIYSAAVGYQFEYINNEEERAWLQQSIEQRTHNASFSTEDKIHALDKLTAAAGLEKYLDVKYPGQKRFSNEGTDVLIPMMDRLVQQAGTYGVKELKIGMAHRGRINVLVNIMGQSAQELFQEFDGTKDYGLTSGDVKYHLGFSSDVETPAGPIHLTLTFNPSHLEFINPVVVGSVRARQDEAADDNKKDYAIAIQIHGDSAFAGQGVMMETLAMSQTRAYCVGGSIHIILNNQVGFTTSNPADTRSSHYCSDLSKMIDAPVFHVNADDPEAALNVMQLALDYRMRFHKDVVIDVIGFRRHGHQEVDEPRATQPLMYQIIGKNPGVRALYAKQLVAESVVDQAYVDKSWEDFRDNLDAGKQVVKTLSQGLSSHYATNWTPFLNQDWRATVDSSVAKEQLLQLGQELFSIPEGFSLQRNVEMVVKSRQKMIAGEQPLDWGCAENLAYASLLTEGVLVRMSGEDCQRGTFFHRQAVLHDQVTGNSFMPLLHLKERKADVYIYNSLLSESGTIGFEYGYSIANPHSLVLWEAQFGDFANGAQVFIDQFLSSGWQKWNRLSGLVLLLPHGYEGMGPEHSSARLERYMQLCAQENLQVCVPSTPAQIFHLLRRQALRPYRKPLIVMSPKSLLRHKLAVSSLDELADGHFQLIIKEQEQQNKDQVLRVILCSGKIYYHLLEKRQEHKLDHIALIRIEQLYPFPYEELEQELVSYKNSKELVWCQEEPKNQGAWFITRRRLMKSKPDWMTLVQSCRPPSAAPAAGYPALYKKLQAEVINKALGLEGLNPEFEK